MEIPIVLNFAPNAVNESSALTHVYPNPATSSIVVEGENLHSVSVYDETGRLVRVFALNGTGNRIPLDVEPGVYFLKVDDRQGNSASQRVVVTR